MWVAAGESVVVLFAQVYECDHFCYCYALRLHDLDVKNVDL